MLPRNNTPIRSAIAIIVWPAFLVSGGRKDGTPLLIASMPVIAVHPVEKVCNSRVVVRGWMAGGAEVSEIGPLRDRRNPPNPSIGK